MSFEGGRRNSLVCFRMLVVAVYDCSTVVDYKHRTVNVDRCHVANVLTFQPCHIVKIIYPNYQAGDSNCSTRNIP